MEQQGRRGSVRGLTGEGVGRDGVEAIGVVEEGKSEGERKRTV